MANGLPPTLTWTWYLATPDAGSNASQLIRSGAVSLTRPVPKMTVGVPTMGAVTSGPTVTVRSPVSVPPLPSSTV